MSRRRVLSFVIMAVGCSGAAKHHIYKSGYSADTCEANHFPYSYWTSADNPENGAALVGSAFAQRHIWEHQHPADCKAARFLIYIPVKNGIGSNYHTMGQALASAMTLDRVMLLMQDSEHPYYDELYCTKIFPQARPSFHDCFFEPISNCTLSDAETALNTSNIDYTHLTDVSKLNAVSPWPEDRVVKLLYYPSPRNLLPPIFKDFLETSSVDPSKTRYWWRAQSVSFLVRPNAMTLAELHIRKAKFFRKSIQPGTIALHIRRGDKSQEYPPTGDRFYIKGAESALFLDRKLKRNLFLLTDDPRSVVFFNDLANWNVSYATIPRSDQSISTAERATRHGKANEIFFSLLDLDLALQCDAWVGTLTSNWSRLIDELRSTVRCKANGIYWDAEQGNPPRNLEWK